MKNPETVMAVRGSGKSFCEDAEYNSNLSRPAQKSKSVIRRDAKTLQYLKKECHRTGRGGPTLQKVFTGLLSVHNKNLTAFAEALEQEGKRGNNR